MNELIQATWATLGALPIYLAWLLIFAVLERLFPAAEHKSAAGWAFNCATSALYLTAGALASGLSALIGVGLRHRPDGGWGDLRISTDSTLAGIAATLLSLFIFDFFYYWWHRSQHEHPILWAIHKLHHLDEGINVSTDLRHHWLEDLGRIPTITVPMAVLFNLAPAVTGAVGFVFSAWTFFIHSNLRLEFGSLSWLFDGPQVHRIHHSRLPEHFDRNFAAFFPIWDLAFGTYFHPRRGEFPPTGVAGEPTPVTVLEGAILPFRTWRQALAGRSVNSPLPPS